MEKCAKTGKIVPRDCLSKCEISNQKILRHLLSRSEVSERFALPEHTVLCGLSHKRVLVDEVEKSSVTGELVAKEFFKDISTKWQKS